MFLRLSRYPTIVHVFFDPILFLVVLKPSREHVQQRHAIMMVRKGIYLSCFFLHFPFSLIYDLLSISTKIAFRNFIYTEDDEDLTFLPKEPSSGIGIGSPSVSANTEPLKANEEPDIQPVKVTTDYGENPKPESSRPPVKRKLAFGSSTSRATHEKTSSSKDDAPFLTVFDDEEGLPDVLDLKDANACHIKISAITPLAWKNHLDNHLDLELLDLHDRYYARQAVADNAVNRSSRELLQVIKKLRGGCDVMRSRERARDEECEGLRVKCEAVTTDFEKNPIVVALREKISALFTESKEHKLSLDKMMLESQKDDICSLIGKLVSSVIVYERCRSFEQVSGMKEPFDLSKVKGYRSSYKKDHTQASNDLATATFPWLDEFVANLSAFIEALLATSSLVPASNLMSLPADASVVKPQSSPPH
uniref:Uncharacterized protein n=1 Tax=Tanacetum cinerariifolium TaxID=118510 RepID=A0A699I353_TANCI|nr:hypothetical protein [Tanacetum cinerariifolium]